MRDPAEAFFDATRTVDPRDSRDASAVELRDMSRVVDGAIEQLATEVGVPLDLLRNVPGSSAASIVKPILPAVPSWVKDTEKWVTLSRAERRSLERHHRKVHRA